MDCRGGEVSKMRQQVPLHAYPPRYSDDQYRPKSSKSNNYFSAKSDNPDNACGHDTKTRNRMQVPDLPITSSLVGQGFVLIQWAHEKISVVVGACPLCRWEHEGPVRLVRT